MPMPCAESALFGPPTPQFRGEWTRVMRSRLLGRTADHPGMLPSADVVAVSISLPCLRKVAMCLRMSGPLDRAGHHQPHATDRLAGHVILFSIGFKGWSAVVREMAVSSLGMADGILVTSL